MWLALAAALASAQTARVVLRWTPVPGAVGYQLEVASDAAFGAVVLRTDTSAAEYRWEALPTTTHWYRVRSVDAEGRTGAWSAGRAIAPASAAPSQVLPEAGAARPCGRPLRFEVAASPLLKTYRVELAPSEAFDTPRVVTSSEPRLEVSDVAPGIWWWRASAVDVRGASTPPGPARRVVVSTPAPALTPMADVAAGVSSLRLRWERGACAAAWQVEVRRGDELVVAERVTQPELSLPAPLLGAYRWRVAAIDASDARGEFGPEARFAVCAPPPSSPSESVEDDTALLRWEAVVGIARYRVEVRAEGAGAEPPLVETVAATQWRTPHLRPGRYRWSVAAQGPSGAASLPTPARVFERLAPTTLEAPVLKTPVDGATFAAGARVEATWTAAPKAVRYEVDVDGGAPTQARGARLRLPALEAGLHVLRVRALGEDAVSPWSEPVRASWGVPAVARIHVEQRGARVLVTLYDTHGDVTRETAPTLEVRRGAIGRPTPEGAGWEARWTPPASGDDALTVSAGDARGEWPLSRQSSEAFSVGAWAGGLFNGDAVASLSVATGVTWAPPVPGRWLTLELRAGGHVAQADVMVRRRSARTRAWLVPLAALVGWRTDLGRLSLRFGIGPGLQLGVFDVFGDRIVEAAPAVETVSGLGWPLGPGRLEGEVGLSWASFREEAVRLNAGGVAVRVGYAVHL